MPAMASHAGALEARVCCDRHSVAECDTIRTFS
jgi:hypothetical protein